jgi:DNA-binding beta-propeller fold protein YncE
VSTVASLTFAALAATAQLAAAAPLRFEFTLDNDYATSAGAYDERDTLVRTLWSNVRYAAGRHEATWDGRDDDARDVAATASYEIRMLTHNVIYTWDGAIGNTSPDLTSPFHHDAPYFFKDLVVSGDRAFFTTPAEGPIPTIRYFKLDDPQYWRARPGTPVSYGADVGLVAADRERVYWSHDSSPFKHTWGKGGDQAFVFATDRDLSREMTFEQGTATCVLKLDERCYRDTEADCSFKSVIDIVTEFREDPATLASEGSRNNVTGLAVQSEGSLLFVAHGQLSGPGIHVLDKRTGRLIANVPLAGVGRLVVGPGRDDLWAIHDGARGGRVVSRLRIGTWQIEQTLSGFENPIGLTLSPDGKQIVVADAGASQQVKAFDATTGTPLWTLGKPGGYRANGPEVTSDKFSFNRFVDRGSKIEPVEQTVLGFEPDGSLWVGDTGLSRLTRFNPERHYSTEIGFVPINYQLAVDRNNPTRVFSEHREYSVDYTQPTQRSWKLVRYYGDGLPRDGAYHSLVNGGFADVATLSNGRTYGLLRRLGGIELVEIPARGDLKRLPPRLKLPVFMNERGDLYSVRADSAGRAEFWRKPLTGFDEGVPVWGREETLALVPRSPRDPRAGPMQHTLERRVAIVEPDLYVLYDPISSTATRADEPAQFHLAATQGSTGRWLWRASPASGPFDLAQPDGVFDSSKPWYAGLTVTSLDDQIVYNFHGEGWHNAGQANQFLHWSRDGLFVGQFGVPNLRGIPPAAAGLAGNSFSAQLVRVNGATYLWHNDENLHAGLQRWHLDGVEWMRELSARGKPGDRIQLGSVERKSNPPHADAAPSALSARVVGKQAALAWKNTARDAVGVEVQRLQPTWVGPRFEPIAQLPASATAFVDANPLPGEAAIYRVRARFAEGASDYSNHVRFTAPAKPVVLESQSFESPPPGLRSETAGVEAAVIVDPADARNHALWVLARKPLGAAPFNARVVWTVSGALYKALNASVGRPRGSPPDIYRVELRLRLVQSNLSPNSDVALMADPGYDLFSTPGRRQSLLKLLPEKGASQLARVSFDFAAIPNGAGTDRGLQQYRSTLPSSVVMALPISLQTDGDVLEFLVDDVTVSRMDLVAEGGS